MTSVVETSSLSRPRYRSFKTW